MIMKYFKKLIGKKCYLSPITVEDAEQYCEWLNDFEIASNLLIFNQQLNLEKERSILQDMIKNNSQIFAIVDLETDKLLGNCSIFRITERNRKAEVGIFIGDKNDWSKGYGTEALTLLIDYGFNILNLNNIMLEVFSFNKRAFRSYKKIGFKVIGHRREALQIAGKKYDEILMDILASEFKSTYIKKIMDKK